jgi:2Fe-2S ferredoxin
VRFVGPDGLLAEADAEAGETLLRVAIVSRLDLSHYCGGTCSCATCRVEIVEGAETLSPMEGREQMVLGYQASQAGDRLACQARVGGDVVVRIPEDF